MHLMGPRYVPCIGGLIGPKGLPSINDIQYFICTCLAMSKDKILERAVLSPPYGKLTSVGVGVS